MNKITNCDLCGSSDIVEFYKGRDEYFSKKEVVFSVCEKCSLIFLNPRPSKEEYTEMYANVFQDKRRNLKTVNEAIDRLKLKGSYQNKEENLKYFKTIVDENSKCLEIGAGWGTLAKVVKDSIGCSVEVVEPSNLAAETAKEYYGLSVFNGDFDEYCERVGLEKKFDLIYSFHVFEHVLDPNDFLKKVNSLLSERGKLLLAVPDVTNPDQPNERFFHIEHCYYYSPNTIQLMLEKNGFKVDEVYRDKFDIKVVCSLDQESASGLSFKNNEIAIIKRALLFYNLRFKVLRFFKRVIFTFISKKNQKKISALAAKILRKLKIIKI
jgi:2-polyprenyl-3-methyl-5-hydroxy-6-metoxy-1,4-benzoquinol methylase